MVINFYSNFRLIEYLLGYKVQWCLSHCVCPKMERWNSIETKQTQFCKKTDIRLQFAWIILFDFDKWCINFARPYTVCIGNVHFYVNMSTLHLCVFQVTRRFTRPLTKMQPLKKVGASHVRTVSFALREIHWQTWDFWRQVWFTANVRDPSPLFLSRQKYYYLCNCT